MLEGDSDAGLLVGWLTKVVRLVDGTTPRISGATLMGITRIIGARLVSDPADVWLLDGANEGLRRDSFDG